MSNMMIERIGNRLWVTGNVDRASEKDLLDALTQYVREPDTLEPVVDLTNVKYFPSSAAKALIGVGQEVEARGARLKIKASLPVTQTLNLLGAKTWLEIEMCKRGNEKPAASVPKESGLLTEEAPLETPEPKPPHMDSPRLTKHIHQGDAESYHPVVRIESQAKATPLPAAFAPKPSGLAPAVSTAGAGREGGLGVEDAAARQGEPMAGPEKELAGAARILRVLNVLQTYTFHFVGGQGEITGKAVEHVRGPWILVECRGTKRLINLEHVVMIDVLN